MLAELGIITITLALILAWYAVGASVFGAQNRHERWIRSARNAALMTWPLLTAAVVALVISQLNNDFQIEYVWSTIERSSDIFFKITALWGGQAGSLLFWSWLLSTFAGGVLLLNWRSERRLMPYVIVFMMGTLAFFFTPQRGSREPFHADMAISCRSPLYCRFATPRRVPRYPGGWDRVESIAAPSGHGDPPADIVPGVRGHGDSLGIWHGGVGFW